MVLNQDNEWNDISTQWLSRYVIPLIILIQNHHWVDVIPLGHIDSEPSLSRYVIPLIILIQNHHWVDNEWNDISTQWWFRINVSEWNDIYSVMVLNQDNEWNDISTQWWFWIKIMSGMTYLLGDGHWVDVIPLVHIHSEPSLSRYVIPLIILIQNHHWVDMSFHSLSWEWNDISTQWWFWIKIMSGMTYLLGDGSESR
jgi:hypothetical protein